MRFCRFSEISRSSRRREVYIVRYAETTCAAVKEDSKLEMG
jgi:hypothetical protein